MKKKQSALNAASNQRVKQQILIIIFHQSNFIALAL